MQYFFKQDKINHTIDSLKEQLKDFSYHQLSDIILPYWIKYAPDNNHGGFYGEISDKDTPIKNANKGLILNARILWTFSSAYLHNNDKTFLNLADRAYKYLIDYFKDNDFKGYYWSLDYTGKPIDRKKQIYSQAFTIYALSEYYKIKNDKKILEEAKALFELIEKHAFDKKNGGYFEAFTREWKLIDDTRLSEKDMNEQKTMNTHLHVLEAYTNLYRVWKDEYLKKQLYNLVDVFKNKFINPEDYHLHLFFDEEWNLKSNDISFGHDIEASWLLYEAAEVLEDKEIINNISQLAINIAKETLKGDNDIGGLIYEMERGAEKGEGMEWWTESEAVVGFYNAYQLSGDEIFLKQALKKAQFIDRYYTDHDSGEWYNQLDNNGKPIEGMPKAGFWKCPYHNARMCIEILQRTK